MCTWNWNGTLCVSHRTGNTLKYNCILVYTIVDHLIAKQSETNNQTCRHMFTKAPRQKCTCTRLQICCPFWIPCLPKTDYEGLLTMPPYIRTQTHQRRRLPFVYNVILHTTYMQVGGSARLGGTPPATSYTQVLF